MSKRHEQAFHRRENTMAISIKIFFFFLKLLSTQEDTNENHKIPCYTYRFGKNLRAESKCW